MWLKHGSRKKTISGGAIANTTEIRNSNNAVMCCGMAPVAQFAMANMTIPAAGRTPGVSVQSGAASSTPDKIVMMPAEMCDRLGRAMLVVAIGVSMGRRKKAPILAVRVMMCERRAIPCLRACHTVSG